jgi:hypothetical protein
MNELRRGDVYYEFMTQGQLDPAQMPVENSLQI